MESIDDGISQEVNNKPAKRKKGRNNKIIIIISVVIILIAVILAMWRFLFATKSSTNSTGNKFSFNSKTAEPKKPKLVASELNGEMVEESLANRHPLGVIVENTPDARPQSGLEEASIVYEAETEGNITRFLAIFGPHGNEKTEVGPVRSARSFFIDWVEEYDGYFAHAGQAKDAGEKIKAESVQDLPHTTGYFERIEYKNVASEHTLYSNIAKLYDFASSKGYSKTANFNKLLFKDDAAETDRGTQTTINVNYPGSYQVTWTYDKTKNIYNRSLAGAPHTMRHSNTQLSAKNIIVQEVSRSPIALEGAKPTFRFQTIGVGKGVIFQDGKKVEVTWKKDGKGVRTKFSDKNGNEFKFNRGVMWFEIIPPGEVDVKESLSEPVPTTTP